MVDKFNEKFISKRQEDTNKNHTQLELAMHMV